MSVYQGSGSGGAGGVAGVGGMSIEGLNLNLEGLSEVAKLQELTKHLGSATAAAGFLRGAAMAGGIAGGGGGNMPHDPAPDANSSAVTCGDFTSSTPDTTKISRHFTLGMLSSQTVYTKYKIVPMEGTSKTQIMCNLKHLAVNTLDPIKDWQPTMKIGSGFRSNSSTDHGRGSAVDIYFYSEGGARAPLRKMVEYAKYVVYELKVPFTQVLVESSGNGTGWFHIANKTNGKNSGLRIGYSLNNGKDYYAGFPNV